MTVVVAWYGRCIQDSIHLDFADSVSVPLVVSLSCHRHAGSVSTVDWSKLCGYSPLSYILIVW